MRPSLDQEELISVISDYEQHSGWHSVQFGTLAGMPLIGRTANRPWSDRDEVIATLALCTEPLVYPAVLWLGFYAHYIINSIYSINLGPIGHRSLTQGLCCGYAPWSSTSSTCTQIVTKLQPSLSFPIPTSTGNTRYPIPWVLIKTYLLFYSHPTMIIRMSLTSLTHPELCIIANREYSLQNTRSKFMVCLNVNLSVRLFHKVEGLLQIPRSHVRIVTRNSSRASHYEQIQNYRVMQSYLRRWIEIYWDAYLSLGFQVGGVSEIVVKSHHHPANSNFNNHSDMNSNGSAKNAIWFENRIPLWLSPSLKKPLVD